MYLIEIIEMSKDLAAVAGVQMVQEELKMVVLVLTENRFLNCFSIFLLTSL